MDPINQEQEEFESFDDKKISARLVKESPISNTDWYDSEEKVPIKFSFKKLMSFAGPGLLMSIAYLDPGNIAGDLSAGIKGRYSLIWTLLWSTVLGWYYQVLAAKLGVATQRNLARNCREQFTPKSRYVLWIMTEIAIIGSDMQEVVGSATAISLLTGWPLYVGAIITILDSFLFLFIHYYGVRKLESFFLLLISIMTITFCTNMVISKPDYGEILYGTVVPTIPKGSVNAMLGLVGAVIMPHNLYLHSALVLSRKVNYRNRNEVNEGNYYNAIESAISLGVSFFINTFVIATFAVYIINKVPGSEPQSLDINNADIALTTIIGPAALYIWAFGLLAAGQSSTMTGTYAGQFVMEGFLDLTLPVWQRVLLTRSIAICPALAVSFLNPVALSSLDNWLNILQSVQLPFALVPLIKFAHDQNIMREFAISRCQYIFASIAGVCLFIMNFIVVFDDGVLAWYEYTVLGIFTFIYFSLIYMVMRETTKPINLLSEKQIKDNEEEYNPVSVGDDDDK